jgi:hypothetical protein
VLSIAMSDPCELTPLHVQLPLREQGWHGRAGLWTVRGISGTLASPTLSVPGKTHVPYFGEASYTFDSTLSEPSTSASLSSKKLQ